MTTPTTRPLGAFDTLGVRDDAARILGTEEGRRLMREADTVPTIGVGPELDDIRGMPRDEALALLLAVLTSARINAADHMRRTMMDAFDRLSGPDAPGGAL